jgi:sigma factor-binding protein Crl
VIDRLEYTLKEFHDKQRTAGYPGSKFEPADDFSSEAVKLTA